jgi:4-amino-4-deoxy-L-arabinose transferase-like glycosyltransferase
LSTIARPAPDLPVDGALARRRLTTLVLGPSEQATWVRPALLGVTLLAAVLYLWDLTVSGWANTYYSMAAQAASQSWSAWFFGSLDAGNFITLDKPPLSTMLIGLSVRVLGLSSWAVLLPQALAGVGTVVVLYHAVRRSFGPVAATIAGIVMSVTPVAVLIFRYDNPDALLTFLLVAAAAALLRALDDRRMRWVVLAAALVGFGFLTKYLQAYLVLPAFALTYAIAAAGSLRHRIAGLAVAAATVFVASGWWVAIVELIPAASRPFIGGSMTNSAVQLFLGYDGLARIFGFAGGPGGVAGGVGGQGFGGPGAGFSGTPGLLRLFNADFGGQISWLIAFAVIGLVSGLWLRRRADRTDHPVAGYLLWGTWLAVHLLVFSFMSGIIHTYYTVALVPAIAALVGAGTVELWRLRERSWAGGLVLGAAVLVSAVLAWTLLERTPDFASGLAWVVLGMGVFAAFVLAVTSMPGASSTLADPDRRRLGLVAGGLAAAALLAGQAAYAIDTVGTAYGGGDPAAGPAVPGASGFGGPGARGGFGGPGGTTDQALLDYLVANRGTATWIVAVDGAGAAAPIQLATGQPVMAMGGFSGSDNAPNLTGFKASVASGQLRFVLLGRGGPGGGGGFGIGRPGSGASTVARWVTASCTQVGLGAGAAGAGGALYDCAGAAAAAFGT